MKQVTDENIAERIALLEHAEAETGQLSLHGETELAWLREFRDLREKVSFKENLTAQIVELQQKLDAMAADNAELKSAANALIKTSEECEINGDEIKHVVGTDEFENLFDCVDKTPATDAYLNSVRAEGVERFIHESAYEIPHRIKCGLMHYANQLRSGTHATADKAGAK